MVTGSTDGIGREYAKQLANRGINIVLISRTKSKLIEVANEIGKWTVKIVLAIFNWNYLQMCYYSAHHFLCVCVCDRLRSNFNLLLLPSIAESKYPVKTKWIVADFSRGKEIYDQIKQQLNGIPIGILGKF